MGYCIGILLVLQVTELMKKKKAKVRNSKNELKENILQFIELVKNEHIKVGFPESWLV